MDDPSSRPARGVIQDEGESDSGSDNEIIQVWVVRRTNVDNRKGKSHIRVISTIRYGLVEVIDPPVSGPI